jgi:heme-degrading monooxygenase HmoA
VTHPAVPFVSFTAVRYSGIGAVAGALHMATQRPLLWRVPGLRFWQLLGTGSGIGFSKKPDLRTWALLAVWESEEAWERFRTGSRVMAQYRRRGEEMYTLLLRPISAHGRWDGVEPFGALPRRTPAEDAEEPVVVLTRAAIRLRRQLRFWSLVAPVDETLRGNPDLLLTFGVGEVPYLRQATLSVWRSERAMREWAYGSEHHLEAVRRTRAEGWYAEELFARFRLLRSYGTVQGRDPLAELFLSTAPGG